MLSTIFSRRFPQNSIHEIRISKIDFIIFNIILLSLLLLTDSAAVNNKELNNLQADLSLFDTFIPLSSLNQYAPMKKSDPGLNDFMSAMNEASRLRYGKRLIPVNNYEYLTNNNDGTSSFNTISNSKMLRNRWPPVKRMASFSQVGNLPALIDSLNGAERLRFGRK